MGGDPIVVELVGLLTADHPEAVLARVPCNGVTKRNVPADVSGLGEFQGGNPPFAWLAKHGPDSIESR
jgi:hypothetical protein